MLPSNLESLHLASRSLPPSLYAVIQNGTSDPARGRVNCFAEEVITTANTLSPSASTSIRSVQSLACPESSAAFMEHSLPPACSVCSRLFEVSVSSGSGSSTFCTILFRIYTLSK
ncbi:unnamed protein product [Protopolystoma xenopodis]|uniref:Uncharacterized protein n=1 Tax=Protopolystoma xenopodis TaxID=117903 RepID=A0A448X6T9_9PLAT|nr:unnamed protein product [Protopolystoma xenopodis]